MQQIYLYALSDDLEPENYRYIGITKNPHQRLQKHLLEVKRDLKTYKTDWIRKTITNGSNLKMTIIEAHTDSDQAKQRERELIALYKERGYRLTNATEGGDGISNPYMEIRKKIGDGNRGKVMSPEARLKIGLASIGRKRTPEANARIGLAHRGKTISLEARKKMSEAHKGKSLSEEHKRHIREARENMSPEMKEKIRLKQVEALKNRVITQETREKMRQARLGRKFSEETRTKLSRAKQGRKLSEETRKKMSEVQRKIQSPERSLRISSKLKGQKRSSEFCQRMSQARRGKIKVDLTGQTFTRLTVIKLDSITKDGHTRWLCQCSCGNQKVVCRCNLLKGGIKGCGCLLKETNENRRKVKNEQ